jgi:UDPglucose 6-dehydrogenase
MKIVIIGYGFVGKAVANALKAKHEIVIQDPKYTDYKMIDHHDADGVIVCVDTPAQTSGRCDDSNVRAVMGEIPMFLPVLIKSTMTPDCFENLEKEFEEHSICHSPEFLRGATANQDFLNQTYMVIGGEDPECFWQDLFASVLPKCKMFFNCSITEAATIKYASNSFLALKVSFFNQIYDVCEKNGADYSVVRQILTHDSRIGQSHTLVPGVDGERGFGGHCFPKDTKAFRKYAYDLNTPVSILDQAIDYNETVRK